MVGAEAFAIGRKPGTDYLIFGAGEEDVAIFGVSVGKSQRSLYEMSEGGCLWEQCSECSLDLS